MNKKLAVLFAFLSGSMQGIAQEQSFDFEVTPYGAYRVGGDFDERDGTLSIDLDDSESFGVILNAKHSPITQWEILYSRQETTANATGVALSDPSPELSVQYLHAGGTYLFEGDKVRPFLAATLGGTHVDVSTPGFDSDTFFSFSFGLGLHVSPNSRLGLRLEARSFGTLVDSDTDLFCQFGPMNNVCIFQVSGSIMWQTEAIAGIVFRF